MPLLMVAFIIAHILYYSSKLIRALAYSILLMRNSAKEELQNFFAMQSSIKDI